MKTDRQTARQQASQPQHWYISYLRRYGGLRAKYIHQHKPPPCPRPYTPLALWRASNRRCDNVEPNANNAAAAGEHTRWLPSPKTFPSSGSVRCIPRSCPNPPFLLPPKASGPPSRPNRTVCHKSILSLPLPSGSIRSS